MKQAIRKFRAKHLHFRFPSEDCECDIAGDGCGCFSDLYYYLGTCVNSEVILDNLFGEVGVDGHLVSFFINRQSPILKQRYSLKYCHSGIFCHFQTGCHHLGHSIYFLITGELK